MSLLFTDAFDCQCCKGLPLLNYIGVYSSLVSTLQFGETGVSLCSSLKAYLLTPPTCLLKTNLSVPVHVMKLAGRVFFSFMPMFYVL